MLEMNRRMGCESSGSRCFGLSVTGGLVALVGCCWLLALSAEIRAEDWPQFRGPNCTGISQSSESLPAEFSLTENVSWSAELGDGVGSPVVVDGRVFTAGFSAEETIALSCIEAATGERLWRKELATGPLPEIHLTNSQAASTPAADKERVYLYVTTLGMLAFDVRNGEKLWTRELPVPYFIFKWGQGMSPVLYNDMVLFCQDDDLHPAIYALDKKTGEIRWKDDRHDMAVNYSHPVICRSAAGDEIVVAGTGLLIGYDPQSGERIWYARTLLRNTKTTPVCHDGIVYVSLQSGGIANQWLQTADQSETGNKDGKLTKEEMQAFVGEVAIPDEFFRKTFDRGDRNSDGVLEGEELDVAFLHPDNFAGARHDAEEPAGQFILAVRGGGRGDVTETHLIWKHPTRHTDHIVSPLVVDGRMLLVKGGGISTCFRADTGEQLWGPQRIRNAGEYFASPVYGDGKIYVAGENGRVVVLKSSPTAEILAVNDLGDSILGTPAIADGRLFFRTRSKLLCIAR